MSFWSAFIRDLKIKRRIHSAYPSMFPGSRIHSLLPPAVEKKIGTGVVIEEGVLINDDIRALGNHVYIGRNTIIGSCDSIGNFCSISSGVRVGLMAHPSDFVSTSPAFYAPRRGWVKERGFDESEGKRTVIGHDVLISAHALVRNGVTIGHGAIVGAGSFVDKDVPPYAVAVGSPAKVIRLRFDDLLIDRLLKSEWWNLPDEKIKAAGNFNDPVAFLNAIGK